MKTDITTEQLKQIAIRIRMDIIESSGSLGQGLSAANGMALFAKRGGKAFRVYAVLGDGEIQEGQVWEAAMSAAHYELDNLTAFLDLNGLQIDGATDSVMRVAPAGPTSRSATPLPTRTWTSR